MEPSSIPDSPASTTRPRAGQGRGRDPWPWVCGAGILILTIVLLRFEGRVWWCDCRTLRPWISDVWTSHCSQHLLDPYSLTHLLHGVIFYGVLAWLAPRLRVSWRFCIAVAVAAGWEVLENSSFIINRYREETMSLDYMGDSAVNALGDILSCAAGFFIARWLGLLRSLALIVAVEVGLLFLIRDNLTLNVIMLIRPVDAIKEWQAAGRAPGPSEARPSEAGPPSPEPAR
jgi:hypothetical protein